MLRLSVVLSVMVLLVPGMYTKCYFPNGGDPNIDWGRSDQYTSCDPNTGGASMCCSQNYGGDDCVPIGRLALSLCYHRSRNEFWRESCTDSSWSSNNCVKLFMNVTDQDIRVTNCSANNLGEGFCYGSKNFGCCKAGMAVFIDPITGEQVATNPSLRNATFSTSSNTTTMSVSTSSSSSSLSSSPSLPPSSVITTAAVATATTGINANSSGLSGSAVHGIIAGVTIVLALMLISFTIWMCCRTIRSKRANRTHTEGDTRMTRSHAILRMFGIDDGRQPGKLELSSEASKAELPDEVSRELSGRASRAELSNQALRAELSSRALRAELPTSVQVEHAMRMPLPELSGGKAATATTAELDV